MILSNSLARESYDLICKTLKECGYECEEDGDSLLLSTTMVGDSGLSVKLNVFINEEKQSVTILHYMPIIAEASMRLDMARAICCVNADFICCSYDYNVLNGDIFFRYTNSFKESPLSTESIVNIFGNTLYCLEKHYNNICALAKGEITLEQFKRAME